MKRCDSCGEEINNAPIVIKVRKDITTYYHDYCYFNDLNYEKTNKGKQLSIKVPKVYKPAARKNTKR